MNNTEDIDKLIKETLTQEEAKFYDELDEQSFLKMIFGIFKGKNSWLNILMAIMQVVFFFAFVYCTIQFFKTEVTNELIKWAVFGSLSFFSSAFLKLFSWMQMDKNVLLREIKRLELVTLSTNKKA